MRLVNVLYIFHPPFPLVRTQLRVVILPIDKSGEMSRMLDRHTERDTRHYFRETNFGVSFLTLSEAESYHPLVAATLRCESQLLEWHGHRSHEQQAKRLLGHDDGCLNRPNGPGEYVWLCSRISLRICICKKRSSISLLLYSRVHRQFIWCAGQPVVSTKHTSARTYIFTGENCFVVFHSKTLANGKWREWLRSFLQVVDK